MQTILKPQEYCYLESPLRSDPGGMIKYTIQGLCATGDIEARVVTELVGRRIKHRRSVAYFNISEQANRNMMFSHAEKFILSLLHKPNMKVNDIRSKIMLELADKPHRFKYDFVYRDVKDKHLAWLRYFPTLTGITERRNCTYLIDHLDANVDSMILQSSVLTSHLNDLGSNLIFLEPITLKKLHKAFPDLSALNFAQLVRDSTSTSFEYFGGDWGGFDAFDSFDGGSDFDFGGGEGGGGGAGDSW